MADESYSFSTARARLEDIVAQVRKKDTSLEKSLDLLEEGVRLANVCTELIDHQDWTAANAHEDAAAGETDAKRPSAHEATDEAGELVAEAVEISRDAGPDFFDADDAWADESEPVFAEHPDEPSSDEG